MPWLVKGALALAGVGALVFVVLRARRGASIRFQVTLAIASITLVATATFVAIVVERHQARIHAFAHRAALDDASVVASLLERGMALVGVGFEGGARMLRRERLLYQISQDPSDTRVELIDHRGRVVFDTRPAPNTGEVLRAPEVRAALAGRADAEVRFSSPEMVVAAAPVRRRGEVVGVVRVHKSASSMAEIARDIGPDIALLGIVLALVAVVIGLGIGREIARPIERLRETAENVARGRRQAALAAPRGKEVRALTGALEAMRAELEERSAIETLATDLSHELKNPLASIRAASEVLEDALEHDLPAARRFNARIAESAAKLEQLTRDLLAMARLEATGIRAAEVDLRAVIEQSVAALSDHAARADVDVRVSGPASLVRSGDAAWLARAVENLVANAITWSPEGGVVRVELTRAAASDEIRVADEGAGVAESIRGEVFERFRTTRGAEGGTGLGLSIVRSVAEAHGGSAELRATGPAGSTFVIVLPRA